MLEVNPVQVVLRGKKRYVVHFVNSNFLFLDYSVRFDFRIISFLCFYLFFRHFFNVRVCICVYLCTKQTSNDVFSNSINQISMISFTSCFRLSIQLIRKPFNHSQSAFDVNYWRECLKSLQRKINRISSRKL